MRRTLTSVAGLGLPALLALLTVAGCGTAAAPPPVPAPTVDAGHNAADVAFVTALIGSHRAGITLASAVARQPDARTLAEAIISTQRDEMVRMTGWLRAWGVTPPPASPPAGVPGNALRGLIAQQQEAVTLAQREQGQGSNRTALDFARQIIESRTAEVDQLRGYIG